MVVEISDLRLYDHYKGFSKLSEQILQTKISLLLKVKEKFPEAKFIFYNVTGDFGTIEKVLKLLDSYFNDVEIVKESAGFNSSPVNNVPVVKVDGALVTLEDVKTIGLLEIENDNEEVCKYDECFYLVKTLKESEPTLNEVAFKIDITPKDTVESSLLLRMEHNEEKFLVLKLLRGENLCL